MTKILYVLARALYTALQLSAALIERHIHAHCLNSHDILIIICIEGIFTKGFQMYKANVDFMAIWCCIERLNLDIPKVLLYPSDSQSDASVWTAFIEAGASRNKALHILFIGEINKNPQLEGL